MDYNKDQIIKNLKTEYIGKEIIFLKKTDSTNDICKECGDNGYDSGTLVIAQQQTNGRGRQGRTWYSPPEVGIYMSLLLRPVLPLNKTFVLTFAAALSVQRAISRIAGLNATIKWPNDIILNNKKVCGILTELKLFKQKLEYAVVGIGVNVNTQVFNKEIKDVAVSLKMNNGKAIDKTLVLINILEEYEKIYNNLLKGQELYMLQEYKDNCISVGSFIRVKYKGENIEGYGIDVDNNGNLIVNSNNKNLKISSGEATIKGLKGYLGY